MGHGIALARWRGGCVSCADSANSRVCSTPVLMGLPGDSGRSGTVSNARCTASTSAVSAAMVRQCGLGWFSKVHEAHVCHQSGAATATYNGSSLRLAAIIMKLATYKDGSRDGQLVVVSHDLSSAHYATGIAARMQRMCSMTGTSSARNCRIWYDNLNSGKARHAFPFDARQCIGAAAACLPVGRRLGVHQPRGAGAHGPQRAGAREILQRPADVPRR